MAVCPIGTPNTYHVATCTEGAFLWYPQHDTPKLKNCRLKPKLSNKTPHGPGRKFHEKQAREFVSSENCDDPSKSVN